MILRLARYLNVAPWELEQAGPYWISRALLALEAELERDKRMAGER